MSDIVSVELLKASADHMRARANSEIKDFKALRFTLSLVNVIEDLQKRLMPYLVKEQNEN